MPILFISESYWRDSVAVVRDVYLPAASTWVWEQDGELKGFVSVLDSRFVGALFVAPGATRQGIGRALLDEVKQHYAWLSLEVYQKNESAVSFYHAQGFRIEDCAWQDDTSAPDVDYALAGGSNAVAAAPGRYISPATPGRCSRHSRCPAGMSVYLWLRRSPPRFCRCRPADPGRATPFMQANHPPGGSPPSPRRRPAPDRGRSIPAPNRHRQSRAPAHPADE